MKAIFTFEVKAMDSLEFCRVGKGRVEKDTLYRIFDKLKDEKFFQPHPFTASFAKDLCDENILDEYWTLKIEDCIAGYFFIRGWFDNWSEKVLGIVILPEFREKGYGELACRFMELIGRERGLQSLRIHVNKNNVSSYNMFEKLGYKFTGEYSVKGDSIGRKNL